MYIVYTMRYNQVIKTTKTLTVDEPGKRVKQCKEAQKDKSWWSLQKEVKSRPVVSRGRNVWVDVSPPSTALGGIIKEYLLKGGGIWSRDYTAVIR